MAFITFKKPYLHQLSSSFALYSFVLARSPFGACVEETSRESNKPIEDGGRRHPGPGCRCSYTFRAEHLRETVGMEATPAPVPPASNARRQAPRLVVCVDRHPPYRRCHRPVCQCDVDCGSGHIMEGYNPLRQDREQRTTASNPI